MTDACAWCGVVRLPGPTCGSCGADYEKAAALRAQEALVPVAAPAPAAGIVVHPVQGRAWTHAADELAVELKLRLYAPPLALVLAVMFHASALGHFLQRTFLSMMVHETGHAITAWYCGYFAVPFLWRTMIAAERGAGTPLLLLALHAYLAIRAWRARAWGLVALVGALVVVQLLGVLCTPRTAQLLFTFGGDAGAMVLGVALMATFFAPRTHHVVVSWLRWGFLVIGAAAFVDTFATWWSARRDWDAIPFGEIEGVGLSDLRKVDLVEDLEPALTDQHAPPVGAPVLVLEAVVGLRVVGALVVLVEDAVLVAVRVRAAVLVLEAILVLGVRGAVVLVVDDPVAVAIAWRGRRPRVARRDDIDERGRHEPTGRVGSSDELRRVQVDRERKGAPVAKVSVTSFQSSSEGFATTAQPWRSDGLPASASTSR